jgi:putative endonuclease
MNTKILGASGEELAVRHLQTAGYAIIDTNVRPFSGMRRGEIDIIAWHKDILCIIEVKTRASDRFDVTEAITISKRRQLTKLAHAYVAKHRLDRFECRFDVVCIYSSAGVVKIIAGAFDPVY